MNVRKIGAGLALIAIVPLLVAAFTRGWMTMSIPELRVNFGLLSTEVCERERCDVESWTEALDKRPSAGRLDVVAYGGIAAVVGTLALVLLLLGSAWRSLRSDRTSTLAPLVLVAAVLGTAGALATLYVLDQWAGMMFRVHLEPAWGYSAKLFFAGAGLAVGAAVLMMIGRKGAPSSQD